MRNAFFQRNRDGTIRSINNENGDGKDTFQRCGETCSVSYGYTYPRSPILRARPCAKIITQKFKQIRKIYARFAVRLSILCTAPIILCVSRPNFRVCLSIRHQTRFISNFSFSIRMRDGITEQAHPRNSNKPSISISLDALTMTKLLGLVTLISAVFLQTDALNPSLLFEKAVGLRRSYGFREEQKGALQTDLTDGTRGAEADKTRFLFDRALYAKTSSGVPVNIFTRESRSANCDFQGVVGGRCKVSDFCQSIAADPDSHTYCQGDFSRYWEITTRDPEICYYIEENEGKAFNETRFDAETDFCSKWTGVFYMNRMTAESFEVTVEISKPIRGVYREVNDLRPCEYPNEDLGFITGYCDSCSAVAIDEKPCNYCNSCPEDFSSGAAEIDCSNIDASLVMSCESNDDDIFTPFSAFVGAECTFDAVVNGRCDLSRFCNQLEKIQGGTSTCSGDVKGTWNINLQREESCYYQEDGGTGLPFDAEIFDESTDYCLNSTVALTFDGGTLTGEEFTYEITLPKEAQGVVYEASRLIPCDAETPDYFFNIGYCYSGCPKVEIDGLRCNTNCIECPDGYEALDCSNVDPNMVESCNPGFDDDFVEEVAVFFSTRNKQEQPYLTEDVENGIGEPLWAGDRDGTWEDIHNGELEGEIERIGNEGLKSGESLEAKDSSNERAGNASMTATSYEGRLGWFLLSLGILIV